MFKAEDGNFLFFLKLQKQWTPIETMGEETEMGEQALKELH